MLEFCCNSDDVRYCGEFNFPKKEGTYYVHIYKKKDFSDNSYIGCIYCSYNKNINRIIDDDDIVYKGELMLIKNNEFVINGKCDKLVIDDECGSTYTGEIKNQKMNGYGIFQKDDVKYEGCYKDGKKHGLIIENDKRYCYYQDDVLKYYCDTEKGQEGITQNVFFEQVDDVYEKIIDKNRIEQLQKLFQEKKQEFDKLKANFLKKKEEEENTIRMPIQNCVILCDESNGKLTILENNDKNNNKNYNEQKKIYTLYLNSQFKEQKKNNEKEKIPEGKYEICFFNGNEKRIYIKGESSKDVIKGTKYYMDGLKEYEGGFNEDYKENGTGIYYNNNKKPYKYGLWENGNFKTGIMKEAENSSIIEIGDFKENHLFNGIRIINNEQKYYEVEYWVDGNLQQNKTEQCKNYNDIEDINFDILGAYYKKYLEYYQKTNDNYITKNNFIIKHDVIRKFQEEDRKAKRNIINEETENCLRFFNEDYIKYCCCVFG